jgi:hypothetical protein
MAVSWLTALKFVPWDKVLAHAPQVLAWAACGVLAIGALR